MNNINLIKNIDEENELSIDDTINMIRNNIGILISFTLLGTIFASILTFLVMTPMYSSTTDLIVNDPQAASTELTPATIQTNLQLLNTYQGVVEKPNVLEKVIEDTGVNLSLGQLAEMTQVTTEPDSLILSINVESDSPYESAQLANSIGKNFVEEVQSILQINNVYVWNEAKPNITPISPNKLLNIMIGTIIGFLIGLGFILVKNIMNPFVQSESIIKELGISPLGVLPEMSAETYKKTILTKKDNIHNSDAKKRRI